MPDKILQIKNDTTKANIESFANILVEYSVIPKMDIAGFKEKYQNLRDAIKGLLLLGVDREKLARAYAKYSEIPYISLDYIDPSVNEVIDINLAKKFGFIPFSYDKNSNTLQAAFFDLEKLIDLNYQAIKELQNKYGIKFEFFVTSNSDVNKKVDLSKINIDTEVLKKMPYDLANKFKAVIYTKIEDGKYGLACVNPDDQQLKDLVSFVEKNSKIKLEIHIADSDQIEDVLQKYYKLINDKKSDASVEVRGRAVRQTEQTSGYENENLTQFLGKERVSIEDIKLYANSGKIPELLATIILLATFERASDIHIEPFEKAVRVRFRVDGELSDVILLPSSMISNIVARVKILSKLKLDEQRIPQDGRFDIQAGKQLVDIRVSTLPTVFGEKVVMRLLTKNRQMEKLEDLGLEGLGYDRIIEAISKPHGVVLSTGPTGSGKTTTLYSILTRLNKPQVNIITLEDPVEYELQGINQVQVKPQIGFGFADGLRSVLRQDPNIIMVGEIRDSETADLVTHAALTGHLVLSTLHTNDSSGALPRLFNLKVEPFLLTSAINAVIAQRLVRKVCQKCREEIDVPQSVIFEVKKELAKLNINLPLKFYRGRGCSNCKNGFSGRIGIFEVLSMNSEIENLVLNKKTSRDIFKAAVESGMITMRQDGFIKAIKGITTVDEVLRVTSEVKEG